MWLCSIGCWELFQDFASPAACFRLSLRCQVYDADILGLSPFSCMLVICTRACTFARTYVCTHACTHAFFIQWVNRSVVQVVSPLVRQSVSLLVGQSVSRAVGYSSVLCCQSVSRSCPDLSLSLAASLTLSFTDLLYRSLLS